jgi:fatty acid desaturase
VLAGPFAPFVFTGNMTANLVRNVWSYAIIFCGHFPEGVQEFSKEQTRNESRGQWYYRQILGSANLTGGKMFHIMSGNLSHQIEHHLFPDIPARRYAEIAARSPVYAQLRTLVDLAVAAAYLQEHDAFGRTQWSAAGLRDEGTLAIERFQPPVHVEPAINAVWRGNRLLTPIGGGVTLEPRMALDSPNLLMDEQGTVAKARGMVVIPADRWWWD